MCKNILETKVRNKREKLLSGHTGKGKKINRWHLLKNVALPGRMILGLPNLLSIDRVSIETWSFKVEIQCSFISLSTLYEARVGYCISTEPVKPTSLSSVGWLLSVNKVPQCTPLAGCLVGGLAGCDTKVVFLPYREIFLALQVSFACISWCIWRTWNKDLCYTT